MQRRLRKLFANLTLAAAALLVAFLLGEVGVRALQRYGVLTDLRGGAVFAPVEYAGKFRMSQNETLRWELDPSDSLVNADGFRGREYDVGKSDAIRIIVLGDSVTFGRGVPFDRTYTRLLEDRLNREERGGLRYEVLNLAVGGYNSRQELELYETKGRKYEPDLLVIGFVLNDATPAADQLTALSTLRKKKQGGLTPRQEAWEKWRERWRTDPEFRRAMGELREAMPSVQPREPGAGQEAPDGEPPGGSRLISLVRDRLERLLQEPQAVRHPWLARSYSDPESWRIVSDSFEGFARIAARDGISVLVVIFPLLTDFENYEFVAIHEQVASEAQRQGFAVLDLYERFRGRNAARFRQSERDMVHLNPAGHRWVAQWIHEQLVASGLLRGLKLRREAAG